MRMPDIQTARYLTFVVVAALPFVTGGCSRPPTVIVNNYPGCPQLNPTIVVNNYPYSQSKSDNYLKLIEKYNPNVVIDLHPRGANQNAGWLVDGIYQPEMGGLATNVPPVVLINVWYEDEKLIQDVKATNSGPRPVVCDNSGPRPSALTKLPSNDSTPPAGQVTIKMPTSYFYGAKDRVWVHRGE